MYNEHAAEAGTLHIYELETPKQRRTEGYARNNSANRSQPRSDNTYQRRDNQSYQRAPQSERQSRPTETRQQIQQKSGPLPAPRFPKKPDDPRPRSLDKYGEPVCPNFGRFWEHPKFCWYHKWYGAHANCCVQPCIWDPEYAIKKWGTPDKGQGGNNNARKPSPEQTKPNNEQGISNTAHLN